MQRTRFLADPDHMTAAVAHMLATETAKQLAGLIDVKKANARPVAPVRSGA